MGSWVGGGWRLGTVSVVLAVVGIVSVLKPSCVTGGSSCVRVVMSGMTRGDKLVGSGLV